ncbi:MAG TPA: helix-turn-helix transcriptional regulator [Solirubrobacterales bacterium]|nr:helix-turn-helix transcriptional regulator [Solirubrobacterales bacterium]
MTETATAPGVGPLLRDWRQRRRLSQLDLALEAGISARHLSFVETGRSVPSPDMVLHLAEQLEVPYRERNRMMLAAGYAPVYRERPLDDPEMTPIRDALDRVLQGHEPYPAVVVDRAWNMVAGNASVTALLGGVAQELLEPPVNVLRASLHPGGMAPQILNLGEWRAHLLERLERQVALTNDPGAAELLEELRGYPGPDPPERSARSAADEIVATLRLATDAGELSFFSTVATFGTAVDITVAELAVESFFPADQATADALRSLPAR